MSKRPGKRRPRPLQGPQLTPQQERFCDEFFRAPSGAQAAVRAGYPANAGRQRAYTLLRNARVQARLAEIAKSFEQDTGISQRRLEREVEALAFSDLRDVVSIDADGAVSVVASADWTPAAAAAVKKVRQHSETRTGKDGASSTTVDLEVELHPKLPAGELLARLRKWLRPDTPFGGQDGTGRIIPAVALPPLAE